MSLLWLEQKTIFPKMEIASESTWCASDLEDYGPGPVSTQEQEKKLKMSEFC